ncbi:hypothetical protein D3C80_2200190 [compost metagenome]
MVLNNLSQTPICPVEFLGFAQQLRGMTDGTQWIADFMGNTRRQSTEGSEF